LNPSDPKNEVLPNTTFEWLEGSAFATAIRGSAWLFPLLKGTHLAMVAVSAGLMLIYCLRLSGLLFTARPVGEVHNAVMPLGRMTLALALASGLLLFISEPAEAAGNGFFQLKIVFLVLIGLTWRMPRVRVVGYLGLLLWIAVLVSGRLMTYYR
jgi:hypothetical protein